MRNSKHAAFETFGVDIISFVSLSSTNNVKCIARVTSLFFQVFALPNASANYVVADPAAVKVSSSWHHTRGIPRSIVLGM